MCVESMRGASLRGRTRSWREREWVPRGQSPAELVPVQDRAYETYAAELIWRESVCESLE